MPCRSLGDILQKQVNRQLVRTLRDLNFEVMIILFNSAIPPNNINAINDNRDTLLMKAVEYNQYDLVKDLLKLKVSLTRKNNQGKTVYDIVTNTKIKTLLNQVNKAEKAKRKAKKVVKKTVKKVKVKKRLSKELCNDFMENKSVNPLTRKIKKDHYKNNKEYFVD